LFVVHDFDPYGFSIRQRLTSVSKWARENGLVKYEFQNDIHEIDLGLRLEDVEQYGLQYEEFEYKGVPDDIEATDAERDFWCSGRRVELNAFTAPQFIEWHEAKLTHHLGPDSFIPSDDVLADAYRRAVAVAHINRAIEATRKKAIEDAKAAPIPKSLRRKLQADIAHSPRAWDKALYDQARESLNLD
jgi:hypothetical protein